jgi:hypothetical protein
METIPVRQEVKDATFRFIKVQVDHPGVPTDPAYPGLSSFSELRIHGERVETATAVGSVRIVSNGADPAKAVNGDTVSVDVGADEPITNVRMTIEGAPAAVTSTDDQHWRGSLVLPADVAYGRAVRFTIDYTTAQGTMGTTVFATTDGSAVQLWNTRIQVLDVARDWVNASTGRSPLSAADNGWRMFDGDLATATDTTTSTGWVTVAPPAGTALEVDAVRVHARATFASRATGDKIQTSSDGGTTWTTVLTFPAITDDQAWYVFELPQRTSFPMLRVLDDHGGFTNVAELQLIRDAE